MMDMGFWPDVRRIVQTLPDSAARQTLLFSATMPEEVMKLADEVVRDAKYVQIGIGRRPGARASRTRSRTSPPREKTEWLAKFLRRTDGPVLVFVRTKSGAERLARKLAAFGLKAAALHADRTQQQRTQAVEGFRSGTLPRARRDRRRGARPRHRRHHARRELRSAVEPRNLRAPRGPHRPRGRDRHRAHAGRARRSCARSRRCSARSGSRCRDDGRHRTRSRRRRRRRRRASRADAPADAAAAPAAPTAVSDAAVEKFKSCRWRCDARRRRVLHASRRAAVCRQGRLQSPTRGARSARSTSCAARRRSASGWTTRTDDVDSRLSPAPDSSTLASALAALDRDLQFELTPLTPETPSPAPPTRPSARAPDTSSSAASLPVSARSSRASPRGRSARRGSRG